MTGANNPIVSVVVLNYRRLEALFEVLASIGRQHYRPLEVIVVDNGSGRDAVAEIRRKFCDVRVIELSHNIGTAARNQGIAAARGDTIVMLDNDVSLDGTDSVDRILAALQRHEAAGCVVFRVYHPATGRLHLRDWCHPRSWTDSELDEFETHYITEGAVAFRKAVFDRVEPYWEPLFIGHEGFDLAVRLMDAGYEIWYTPDVKVWHAASVETRQNWRPFYYYTRNLFPTVYRSYPLRNIVPYLLPRVVVLGYYSLRSGHFLRHLAGIRDGVALAWQYRANRKAVHRETIAKIADLKRSQAGPIARFLLARQRTAPLSRS